MAVLAWDQTGQRKYETGVDRGVLFVVDGAGAYGTGVVWNGLVSVTESPSGAEATPQYADNIKYLNLISAEEFGGTIEAFHSPVQFDICDGTATPYPGVTVTQQSRRSFGLAYRNFVGNDTLGTDFGEKIHLVYGAVAAPSEKTRGTVNDSPEAVTFSWEFTTSPIDVPGLKPSAHIIVDSTVAGAAGITALKNIIWGTAGADSRLPLPAEVFGLFAGAITTAVPTKPVQTTNTVAIPVIAGVDYKVGNTIVTGTYTLPGASGATTIITAVPKVGFAFAGDKDYDWDYIKP